MRIIWYEFYAPVQYVSLNCLSVQQNSHNSHISLHGLQTHASLNDSQCKNQNLNVDTSMAFSFCGQRICVEEDVVWWQMHNHNVDTSMVASFHEWLIYDLVGLEESTRSQLELGQVESNWIFDQIYYISRLELSRFEANFQGSNRVDLKKPSRLQSLSRTNNSLL